ncbi:lantibiotic immunity ABC transporter MutG family permease subunit [Clostridium thailandense]|uniref:lantibiotic immunity ABC transporter MutG family permease subunit n=1 Tax=Clostridium thailandense TaxID=2794346 RepID=UPI003989374C
MSTLFRLIAGDFRKIQRSSIVWIHVIVPILITSAFLFYYSFSNINNISKVEGFMEVLSVGFPLIIGIVCAMVVEQEACAGNFQELLMSKNKLLNFVSKVCMLIIMALGSLITAIGGLALGLKFLLHKNPFSAAFYGKIILLLLFCEIFLYLMHLLCSFKFGSGASIGIGIAEGLVSALMLTGLGDGLWQLIPCSWGGRVSNYYIQLNTYKGNIEIYRWEFQSGIYMFIIATVLLFLASLLWFNKFEGRRED